jgi:phosphatidylcholine synthase
MSEQYSHSPVARLLRTFPAWCVHLYTASSAVVGVWAIHATFQNEFRLAIYLMLLTIVIDATDGMWARAVDVRGKLPWFDGRRLDDICDYFTYVIVPACFLIQTELLPHPAWVALPVLASGYGFSQDKAKTEDHFFLGFPSYWNVVAMYMYLMEPAPGTALAIIAGLSAAVFVPLRFIYPSRTRVLRPVSLVVMALWALVFSWVSVRPDPDPLWLHLSLLGPAYYVGLSLLLNVPVLRHAAMSEGRT